MQEGKYFRLTHFVPNGFPQVFPGSSEEVKQMMPYLIETTPVGWTKIPNHMEIEMFASRKGKIPIIGFRKNGKEAYVHVFCNEFVNPKHAIQIVAAMYLKFRFGKPQYVKTIRNWIHTIPVSPATFDPAETLLTHQLTNSIFWTIYMDYKRIKETGPY